MDPLDALELLDVTCECGDDKLLWHCRHSECLWIVCGDYDCGGIVDGSEYFE